MAVTGTGTESDPYLVHSYTELAYVFSGKISLGYGVYIQLENDIDCNDYGVDFVWHTLSAGYNTRRFILDLNNHTIKNVQIASGENMFKFSGGNGNQCVIKNGKLLNIFMNASKGFNDYTGGLYVYGLLQNVSISVNASGVLFYPFYCGFDSCAVYVEGGSTSQTLFAIPNSVSATMKNTDVLLNDAKGYRMFDGTAGQPIIDSRIRGKFTSEQNYLADGGDLTNNCVFDFEYNRGYLTGNGGTNTGIINSDKLSAGFDARGMTKVTSQEMINGDALRAKGFVVVNVSA